MITGSIMDMPENLVERLRRCAALWIGASDATPARLGRVVVNDGGFFTRIEGAGASVTTATLEKFAAFFGSAANWPGEAVPAEVVDFVRRVSGAPPQAAAA